jgi:hypothetical protein
VIIVDRVGLYEIYLQSPGTPVVSGQVFDWFSCDYVQFQVITQLDLMFPPRIQVPITRISYVYDHGFGPILAIAFYLYARHRFSSL